MSVLVPVLLLYVKNIIEELKLESCGFLVFTLFSSNCHHILLGRNLILEIKIYGSRRLNFNYNLGEAADKS